MISNTELNNLVKNIFTKRYAVVVAPIYEDMCQPEVQVESIAPIDMCDGHRIEVDNRDEEFIAQYLNSTIDYTGDEEEDNRRAYEPVERNLPATTIASILAMDGQLRLVNPSDATVINSQVSHYLTQVRLRLATEVNYKGPPKDDLDALDGLLHHLAPIVEIIRLHGKGKAEWDQVMSSLMMGGVARRIGRIQEDEIAERQKAVTEVAPPPVVDPYKF